MVAPIVDAVAQAQAFDFGARRAVLDGDEAVSGTASTGANWSRDRERPRPADGRDCRPKPADAERSRPARGRGRDRGREIDRPAPWSGSSAGRLSPISQSKAAATLLVKISSAMSAAAKRRE